jgi:hypothetical protein
MPKNWPSAPRHRLKIRHRHQHERLASRQIGSGLVHDAGRADRLGEALSRLMAPAAGHGDELIRPPAQFFTDVFDDQVEVAALADHTRQNLAVYRRGRSKNHRLDAAHPFAPAQFPGQVLELDIEGDLGFGAPAHR